MFADKSFSLFYEIFQRELIALTRQELTDANAQRKFIELIETVFVYKFPQLRLPVAVKHY
ncbi:MAG: DUF2887 domain-containing protein [Calothrix sp. MO_167.B42]|nr:DUF2887 domain-containing protein [Calothrix sp. MO_167.B42]